jgi:hypothetical protein
MPTAPHWLRFSLRTMFVAFTVMAVWFDWNANLVRERKNVLRHVCIEYTTGHGGK